MSLFNFKVEELITFFAVLVRYSVLFSVLPFIGDRSIPSPIKITLALVTSIALYPALVRSGQINPSEAYIWGISTGGIIGTVSLEVLFALTLGFTARLVFEGISFGANLVGNFMGFAAASTYDPHQESQTQVIAQFQMAIAMLVFLALDGHHLMLKASLDSYRIVGLGKAAFDSSLSQRLAKITSEVFIFGIQVAAPVAISLFSVNLVFGMISKAMPQLNIFMLSFAVTAIIGFVVMFLSLPEFQGSMSVLFARMFEHMQLIMLAMVKRG
jgi:flagellar biosynthetic protein FliR